MKSSTRDILWMAWKTDEGSPVSPGQCFCTQVCGCHGCCAWLWLWTGWSPSIFSWFGTIRLLFVPQHKKKTWLGSSIGRIMRSYLQVRTFSRIRMRASIPRKSKHCNTNGRSVWTAGETVLKINPYLVKFNHCIIVSLWTFQPTHVYLVFFSIFVGMTRLLTVVSINPIIVVSRELSTPLFGITLAVLTGHLRLPSRQPHKPQTSHGTVKPQAGSCVFIPHRSPCLDKLYKKNDELWNADWH